MKSMRILLAVFLVLLVGSSGCLTLQKCGGDEAVAETAEEETDSDEETDSSDNLEALLESLLNSDEDTTDEAATAVNEDEVPVPTFVRLWLGGIDCMAETLCTTRGRTFYQAYACDNIRNLIYDDQSVIVSGLEMAVEPLDSTDDCRKKVSMFDRSMTVDFGDKASVNRLRSFGAMLPHFTRYLLDTLTDIGFNVQFDLELDYPEGHTTYEQRVKKWLVETLFSSDEAVSISMPFYMSGLHRGWGRFKYKGDVNNYRRIATYAAAVYFSEKKDMYANADYYPVTLFLAISYRARISNGRYVTYQEYTNEYSDGLHGYCTERLLSYDVEHQCEVDFDYLFKPGTMSKVKQLFYLQAIRDERFKRQMPQYDTTEDSVAEVARIIDKWIQDYGDSTAALHLPRPALSESGVVFSFQPYEIGCFADGTFHFTIPYRQLSPYLTEQGHWCLNM